MNIKDNVERVKDRIIKAQLISGNKTPIKIVAITKNHPASFILETYRAGLDNIGENRIQEAEVKFMEIAYELPDITKRLVGHLQSNKINKALSIFDKIDSVDSLELASKIGKKAVTLKRTIQVLLEVNTSEESAKYGFNKNNIDDMIACFEIKGIEIHGLMTIGPLGSEIKTTRAAFATLRQLRDTIKNQLSINAERFSELSMGMSNDFEIAIEEGASMVRLGTILFGQRSANL